jgi:16S rRNA (cytosine1402-N4)-methyltransferase
MEAPVEEAEGTEKYHTPVLLEEVLEYLMPEGDGAGQVFIDGTLGEGGHTLSFMERFVNLSFIGIDRDTQILNRARERIGRVGKSLLNTDVQSRRIDFAEAHAMDFFERMMTDGKRADRILLDLGVSLFHYASGRGFSFQDADDPLDMRLSCVGGTAAELLGSMRETEIADMLFRNAGERHSRRIAKAICEARRKSPVRTAGELAAIVTRAVPSGGSVAAGGHKAARRLHPATKTFAALRIEVNGELKLLPRMLNAAAEVLNRNGRLGVISFHSDEDRIVKTVLRDRARCDAGGFVLITKKPVPPREDEIKRNPPSRSAKLRVLGKVI